MKKLELFFLPNPKYRNDDGEILNKFKEEKTYL